MESIEQQEGLGPVDTKKTVLYTFMRMAPLAALIIVEFIDNLSTGKDDHPIESSFDIIIILLFPICIGSLKKIHPDLYTPVTLVERMSSLFYWLGDLLLKMIGNKLPGFAGVTFPWIRLEGRTQLRVGQTVIPMMDKKQAP